MQRNLKIFICYAREDEDLRLALEKQLGALWRQDLVHIWHDRNISAGTEWAKEISAHLNTAQIILLLISPDFMNSDYCYSVEMKCAMERHTRGEARVIPILLRPVSWAETPFGKLQALPTDAKPVTTWRNQDEAFLNVVEGIQEVLKALEQPKRASLGTVLCVYRGHYSDDMAWSPDGCKVVSCSSNRHTGQLEIWDATSGQKLQTSTVSSPWSVAWSPDGKQIAFGSGYDLNDDDSYAPPWGDYIDSAVHIWNAFPAHVIVSHHFNMPVLDVEWSPDGTRVTVVESNGKVHIQHAITGDHLLTYEGHSSWGTTAAWSPDGTRIASADYKTVQVWDAVTGNQLLVCKDGGRFTWSPDGKYLASGDDEGTIQIWDIENKQLFLSYKVHEDSLTALSWSPDGKCLASGDDEGTIQLWDVILEKCTFTHYSYSNPIETLAWSPDGLRIASVIGGEVVIWQVL